MSRAVVISGIGVFSPAGRGISTLASSAREGRCCLAPDDELRALGARCGVSGRVPGVGEAFGALPIEAEDRDFFGRLAQIGAVAAFDAVEDAKGDRAAALGRVVVASAVGPMSELRHCFGDTLKAEAHPHRARAVTRVTPSFLPTFLAGAVGALRGGRVVSAACVSAIEALRDAWEMVASGQESACLVGAVDEDCASTWWAFDHQRLLARTGDPAARTRALSGKRGGFVPSGGAAFFVVEAEEDAMARGKRPIARLSAVALRSDPRGASLIGFPALAYRGVLADVGALREPFDLVMAHAPPSVADLEELGVLDEVLGVVEAGTPVRSCKSIVGYALGAGAALDVALGAFQIAEGEVLPNDVGMMDPAAERFAKVVLGGPSIRPVRRVLKTAYAQGRVAGAVVLEAGPWA